MGDKKGDIMKIVVGSTNQNKIDGVAKACARFFSNVNVIATPAESGVHEQPFGFEEIVNGAKKRAISAYTAYRECQLSIGIEAGFVDINKKHMNITVAAAYDGKKVHLGCGPMFEVPDNITERVVKKRESFGEMINEISNNKTNSAEEGAIGFLTDKKVLRHEINEWAVCMALVPWIKKELYHNEKGQ